jgi:hypothetical protein
MSWRFAGLLGERSSNKPVSFRRNAAIPQCGINAVLPVRPDFLK